MIINNNNNNNPGCGCGCQQEQCSAEAQPAKEKENAEESLNIPKGYDRKTMIFLAKYLGWSGWHFFHFNKPFLGMLHLLLSIVGLIGAASLLYIVLLVDNAELYFRIACYMIPAFLVSVLSGVICSFYWSLKDDESFQRAYPDKQQ